MKKKLKVIAICGSERKDGNTERALKYVLDIISKHGIETELITLWDKNIKGGCKGCRYCRAIPKVECAIKDDFYPEIFNKMLEADGIIIGSPVYFGSTPTKLKAVLERAGMLSEGRFSPDKPIDDKKWPGAKSGLPSDKRSKGPGLFKGKVGGAIVSTRRTGGNFTLAELLMWFSICNFVIVSSSYWTVLIGSRRIPDAITFKKDGQVFTTSDLSRDQLEVDEEGRFDLEEFAENFAYVVKKLRGSEE